MMYAVITLEVSFPMLEEYPASTPDLGLDVLLCIRIDTASYKAAPEAGNVIEHVSSLQSNCGGISPYSFESTTVR
jgi:hypothetical protein